MMLTTLDVALRNAGLAYVEEPGWRNRGRGQMSAVRTITIHHTAGGDDASDRRVVRDGRRDLPGPLSHILLETNGTPRIIAAGLCAHAGESRAEDYRNPYAIGIEAVHDGVSRWTAAKYAGLVACAGALAQHYGLPVSRIVGHKETCRPVGRKVDPNFDMDVFRHDVAAWLVGQRTPAPTQPVVPPLAKPKPGPAKLATDGIRGPLTIKAMQRWLGVTADGLIGPNTIRALQRKVGARVDGILGPITIRGLQRLVGVGADGKWGPRTTRALQVYLNTVGAAL